MTAMGNFDTGPIHLHNERADSSVTRLGHDYDDLSHRPIGAPEFLTV